MMIDDLMLCFCIIPILLSAFFSNNRKGSAVYTLFSALVVSTGVTVTKHLLLCHFETFKPRLHSDRVLHRVFPAVLLCAALPLWFKWLKLTYYHLVLLVTALYIY
jgi:hypothetical protein